MSIKDTLYEAKEGIIIGGLVGFLVYKFFLPESINLTDISQTQSLVDIIKPATTSVIEFAKTKLFLGLIVIGATIGGLVDLYREKIPIVGEWL